MEVLVEFFDFAVTREGDSSMNQEAAALIEPMPTSSASAAG